MINVYDSKTTGTGFNNNGLVILKDCKSISITEALNGTYELTLEHPLDIEGRWKYLIEDNIIRADGQLFRCYHKVTTLSSRTINARSIFYDQIDNYVEGATIIGTADDAMAYINSHKQYADEFTLSSDLVESNTLILPSGNPVDLIMGTTGLISVLKGELLRDNFDIKLLANRGSNKNVLISYGKNIKGIEEQVDLDSITTRLNIVGTESEKKIYLPEKYVDSPLIGNYSHPKIRTLELPMDIIQYAVTPAVTTAISVYKSASVINNDSFSGDVADTKIIATISGKERIEASEKVSLNTIWQAIHTDYNVKYNLAVAWFDGITAIYPLLDDLKTAIPKGNDNIYEVTNADTVNGQKWYYWDSFVWTETERINKQLDNYTTAYNMLKDYLEPILASMSTPTNIHSTEMKAKFKTYYTDRSIITTAVFNKTINSLWKIRSKANLDNYVIKLRQMATDYFKNTGCDLGQPNYTIDFVELSKTEEYKNYKVLQGVELGDTVIVRHVKLGIDLQLEVIKTTKNILTNRLDVVELGSLKATLATNFTNTEQAIQAINTRVGSLETNTAKVVDGVIVNGTLDFTKINAMESLYSQLTNSDSNADIYVDSITGRLATFDTLVAGNITAENIKTGTITADSGIIANLAVGDAQISHVSAVKIDSGSLDTSKVDITSPDGRLLIQDNTMLIYDYINNDLLQPFLRVQTGRIWDIVDRALVPRKDINDNYVYGFEVRDKTGQSTMIDGEGVHNEGITDGAVDNSKISPTANIDGAKLNISTVITAINGGTTTIQGSKIYMDNKTLDVSFSEMSDTVNSQSEIISNNSSAINQNAQGISSVVSSLNTTNDAVSGKINSAQASTIAQTASNVQIGFNGITNNVVMDSSGLTVNNGAVTIKNNNNVVVFDGSKTALQVLSTGFLAMTCPAGTVTTTSTITTNLGAIHTAILGCEDTGGNLYPMPHVGLATSGGSFVVPFVVDAHITANTLVFAITRGSDVNANAVTWYMSYQILAQSAQ